VDRRRAGACRLGAGGTARRSSPSAEGAGGGGRGQGGGAAGTTLIPGLIELHSHLLLHPYNETLWDDQVLKEAPFYRTLRPGRDAGAR
jgi:cytosine/adenosine deaminase-related metal-dependent hydrolase